jgi:hypothetical protein
MTISAQGKGCRNEGQGLEKSGQSDYVTGEVVRSSHQENGRKSTMKPLIVLNVLALTVLVSLRS